MVLSRDIPEIKDLISQGYTQWEVSAQSEDLKLYVAAEIETRQRRHGRGRLRIGSPELKDHIMKTLVERAGGMFRWVACQIDYLCELPTDAEKRKALKSLPPTLNETYERILDGVSKRGPAIQRVVQSTLQWLVNSYERLTVPALCDAISLKEGDRAIDKESAIDEETILLHCSCLVRKSANSNYLELAHFTVQEFLTNIESNSPFSIYSQRKDEVQPLLARTCLTYLLMDAFQHDVVEGTEKWEEQLVRHPLRAHAALYWIEYAEYSWENDEILALARQLFHPFKTLCFLSWARDYFFVSRWKYLDSEKDRQLALDEATILIFDGSVTPIHLLAAIGLPSLCQWLLDSDCEVNQPSAIGTPLHCSLVGILSLSDALHYEDWLETPHEFMWEGRTQVLDMLIANGADLTATYRDPYGEEYSCAKLALHASLGRGPRHPLITLVAAGAKLDKGLLTAFEHLIDETDYNLEGHEEFVGILIERLEENTENDIIKGDLLTAALRFKSSAALVKLRGEKEGPWYSLNIPDEELREIFLRAIRFDRTDAMEYLLRDGRLNVSSIDDDGETFLHIAAEHEATNATKMLLSLGVNANAKSKVGLTPLHRAVGRETRNPECVLALLDADASIAMQTLNGRTAWHIAAQSNNVVALKILAARDGQKPLSLVTSQKEGFIPLFYAASCESEAAVEFLLSETTKVPETCPYGLGIVHYVVQMNSIKLLRLLRAKGLPIDQKSKNGGTALHFIPQHVDPDVVRFLIESGVEPSSTDEDGHSPLHRFIGLEISKDQQVFELLATNESLPLVGKYGGTALHYAVGFTRSPDSFNDYPTRELYVKWLIDKGASFNCRNENGDSCITLLVERHGRMITFAQEDSEIRSDFLGLWSFIVEGTTDLGLLNESFQFLERNFRPLCWAILFNEPLAQILLARGVEVDLMCHTPTYVVGKDWSAIHFACSVGSGSKLFEQILKASKKLEDHDSRGYYLPHLACEKGSKAEIYHLKQLCDAGVDLGLHSACSEAVTPLMLASAAGKLELVEYLLDCGTDFSARDADGWQAVQYAALEGHADVLELYIGRDIDWSYSVDILYKGKLLSDCNMFHLSMLADKLHVAQWLLKNSLAGDLESWNGDGNTPLHLASIYGLVAHIEVLITAGANIEAVSAKGLRPIHSAALAGREDIVRVLLNHGCELVADSLGLTPELYALKENRPDIVRLLKDKSSQKAVQQSNADRPPANNTVTDPDALRSLRVAIEQGDLELCKSLVKAGISIDQPLEHCHGCTPVLLALNLEREHIARYFIEEGASTVGQLCSCIDVSDLSYKGYSAVHLACRRDSQVDLLKLLLAKDIEDGSPAFRGPVSPIHVAIACNNTMALKVLLQHGRHSSVQRHGQALCEATIEASKLKWEWMLSSPVMKQPHSCSWYLTTQSFAGGSGPLHVAACVDNSTATKILLEYGSEVNNSNNYGETPLHIAASNGHQATMSVLLQHGANPVARDNCGRTPALFAASGGNLETLRLLSNLPNSLSQCDIFGDSILHHASKKSPEVFSYLLGKGISPYITNHYGFSAVPLGFDDSRNSQALQSLVCNWDLDFRRVSGLISGRNWTYGSRLITLKLILRRLPKSCVAEEINLNTNRYVRGSPLSQVAKSNRIDVMELLVRAGASLEVEVDNQGTPLISACLAGRLSAVRYLVRAGANLFGTKDGKPCSAVRAARDFPSVVQWLLVERFTEQHKILSRPDHEGQEIRNWSGGRSAHVTITGLYSPEPMGSTWDRVRELDRIRRQLRGEVVVINDFND